MNRLSKFGMAMLAMLALAGCGSNKKATTNAEIERLNQETELIKARQRNEDAKAQAEQAERQRQANAAVGEEIAKKQAARLSQLSEMPCFMQDDDEWFYATGMRQVKANSFNTAVTATLRVLPNSRCVKNFLLSIRPSPATISTKWTPRKAAMRGRTLKEQETLLSVP